MKKTIALLVALALTVSAAAALAAAPMDTVSGATQNQNITAKGGMNGQMPGFPGNGQNNQQNGQLPQMPGNGQMDQNSWNGMNGKGFGGHHGGRGMRGGRGMFGGSRLQSLLAELVKENILTQETVDKINEYLNSKMPAAPAAPAADSSADATAEDSATLPALPDGQAPAEGEQPADAPALPDGQAPAEGEDSPELKLLKEMLAAGIITQEQYDAIVARLAAALPEMPAAPAEAPADASADAPAATENAAPAEAPADAPAATENTAPAADIG